MFQITNLAQVKILRELDAGEDEVLDFGVDPDDHGRERELLRERGVLEAGVRVREAVRDALVLAWRRHLMGKPASFK